METEPTYIEIDTLQLRKNFALMRKAIGRAKFCLPIKANAYGHGLLEVARIAEEEGINCLGAFSVEEGVFLRKGGISIPILVFGAIHESQMPLLAEYELEFSISSKLKADLVAKHLQKRSKVHLEIDTGMQRTGVRLESAKALLEHVKSYQCFEVCGIFSHLATADSPDNLQTIEQIDAFKKLIQQPHFENLQSHIASSGGVVYYPNSYFDMVRPGLLAYGYVPKGAPKAFEEIAPCFSLKSKVSYFKVVEKGRGISYGHTHVTEKRTRIATIPIGYGHGYLRALSNRGSVLIRGEKFPIVGAICMDQLMVDIQEKSAYVGDEVVLIGRQNGGEILLGEIAALCHTIPYEILTLFNGKLVRRYV